MVRYASPFLIALLFTFASPGSAPAEEGFRCGSGRLVSTGDHMAEVRNKCGDPDSAGQRVEKRTRKEKVRRWVQGVAEEFTEEREIEVILDEWVYDLGPRRFMRMVTFENGRVIHTATGDKGSKQSS
jgi:Protein of unknown function (DUF2845)